MPRPGLAETVGGNSGGGGAGAGAVVSLLLVAILKYVLRVMGGKYSGRTLRALG
jgi:hypothetical protein